VVWHAELATLSVAHADCDAFYASVEKRDDPSLADVPVIVGGGQRGVVSTCCYLARIRGVRSAMPMFQALKLCPEARVLKPRMEAYVAASRAIRAMMEELTPAVEPLSLDEAFLDLSGTERLHGARPAVLLARLARRVEAEVGVTLSIGLSHNKFLAKIASDLDKPRGFSVIGREETAGFLARQKVSIIFGVGHAFSAMLERDGIRTIADLLRRERSDLIARYGVSGERLWHLARGQDRRRVDAHAPLKTISNETTFMEDISDPSLLEGHLWRLAEKVSDRAKAKGLAGRVVTLKLKERDFTLIARRQALAGPTDLADTIFRTALPLMQKELHRGPFRLAGVGLANLVEAADIRALGDLLDPGGARRAASERAADTIRRRFGEGAILKGRSLR
jgi:DNA polymerase-4